MSPTPDASVSPTPTVTLTPTKTPAPPNIYSLWSFTLQNSNSSKINLVNRQPDSIFYGDFEIWEGNIVAEVDHSDFSTEERRESHRNLMVNFFENFQISGHNFEREKTTLSLKTKKIKDFPFIKTSYLDEYTDYKDENFVVTYENEEFGRDLYHDDEGGLGLDNINELNFLPKKLQLSIDKWDGDYSLVFEEQSDFLKERARSL